MYPTFGTLTYQAHRYTGRILIEVSGEAAMHAALAIGVLYMCVIKFCYDACLYGTALSDYRRQSAAL